MAATAQVSVKLDPKYKKIFEATAENLGLNTSDAYSIETMTALRNAEAGVGLHKVKDLDELRSIMVG